MIIYYIKRLLTSPKKFLTTSPYYTFWSFIKFAVCPKSKILLHIVKPLEAHPWDKKKIFKQFHKKITVTFHCVRMQRIEIMSHLKKRGFFKSEFTPEWKVCPFIVWVEKGMRTFNLTTQTIMQAFFSQLYPQFLTKILSSYIHTIIITANEHQCTFCLHRQLQISREKVYAPSWFPLL